MSLFSNIGNAVKKAVSDVGNVKVAGVSLAGGLSSLSPATLIARAATSPREFAADTIAGARNAGAILTAGAGAATLAPMALDIDRGVKPAIASPASVILTQAPPASYTSIKNRIDEIRSGQASTGAISFDTAPPVYTAPPVQPPAPIFAPTEAPPAAVAEAAPVFRLPPPGLPAMPTAAPPPMTRLIAAPGVAAPSTREAPVSILGAIGKIGTSLLNNAPRAAAAANAFRPSTTIPTGPMPLMPTGGGIIATRVAGPLGGVIGGAVGTIASGLFGGGATGVPRLSPGSSGGCGCSGGSGRDPCTHQAITSQPAPLATFFGGCCPPGRTLRRINNGRDICIKTPRMNPFNPRALARADRRVTQFARRSSVILRGMGFQVSRTKKVHGVSVGGAKRRGRARR